MKKPLLRAALFALLTGSGAFCPETGPLLVPESWARKKEKRRSVLYYNGAYYDDQERTNDSAHLIRCDQYFASDQQQRARTPPPAPRLNEASNTVPYFDLMSEAPPPTESEPPEKAASPLSRLFGGLNNKKSKPLPPGRRGNEPETVLYWDLMSEPPPPANGYGDPNRAAPSSYLDPAERTSPAPPKSLSAPKMSGPSGSYVDQRSLPPAVNPPKKSGSVFSRMFGAMTGANKKSNPKSTQDNRASYRAQMSAPEGNWQGDGMTSASQSVESRPSDPRMVPFSVTPRAAAAASPPPPADWWKTYGQEGQSANIPPQQGNAPPGSSYPTQMPAAPNTAASVDWQVAYGGMPPPQPQAGQSGGMPNDPRMVPFSYQKQMSGAPGQTQMPAASNTVDWQSTYGTTPGQQVGQPADMAPRDPRMVPFSHPKTQMSAGATTGMTPPPQQQGDMPRQENMVPPGPVDRRPAVTSTQQDMPRQENIVAPSAGPTQMSAPERPLSATTGVTSSAQASSKSSVSRTPSYPKQMTTFERPPVELRAVEPRSAYEIPPPEKGAGSVLQRRGKGPIPYFAETTNGGPPPPERKAGEPIPAQLPVLGSKYMEMLERAEQRKAAKQRDQWEKQRSRDDEILERAEQRKLSRMKDVLREEQEKQRFRDDDEILERVERRKLAKLRDEQEKQRIRDDDILERTELRKLAKDMLRYEQGKQRFRDDDDEILGRADLRKLAKLEDVLRVEQEKERYQDDDDEILERAELRKLEKLEDVLREALAKQRIQDDNDERGFSRVTSSSRLGTREEDRERRKEDSEWLFGFTMYAELLNGRLAMSALAFGLLMEYLTGMTLPAQVANVMDVYHVQDGVSRLAKMSSETAQQWAQSAADATKSSFEDVQEGAERLAKQSSEKAKSAVDATKSSFGNVQGGVEQFAKKSSETAQSAVGATKASFENVQEGVGQLAKKSSETAKSAVEATKSSFDASQSAKWSDKASKTAFEAVEPAQSDAAAAQAVQEPLPKATSAPEQVAVDASKPSVEAPQSAEWTEEASKTSSQATKLAQSEAKVAQAPEQVAAGATKPSFEASQSAKGTENAPKTSSEIPELAQSGADAAQAVQEPLREATSAPEQVAAGATKPSFEASQPEKVTEKASKTSSEMPELAQSGADAAQAMQEPLREATSAPEQVTVDATKPSLEASLSVKWTEEASKTPSGATEPVKSEARVAQAVQEPLREATRASKQVAVDSIEPSFEASQSAKWTEKASKTSLLAQSGAKAAQAVQEPWREVTSSTEQVAVDATKPSFEASQSVTEKASKASSDMTGLAQSEAKAAQPVRVQETLREATSAPKQVAVDAIEPPFEASQSATEKAPKTSSEMTGLAQSEAKAAQPVRVQEPLREATSAPEQLAVDTTKRSFEASSQETELAQSEAKAAHAVQEPSLPSAPEQVAVDATNKPSFESSLSEKWTESASKTSSGASELAESGAKAAQAVQELAQYEAKAAQAVQELAQSKARAAQAVQELTESQAKAAQALQAPEQAAVDATKPPVEVSQSAERTDEASETLAKATALAESGAKAARAVHELARHGAEAVQAVQELAQSEAKAAQAMPELAQPDAVQKSLPDATRAPEQVTEDARSIRAVTQAGQLGVFVPNPQGWKF